MSWGTPSAWLIGALALLLVSAGIEDVRRREIANWKNGAIALLAPLWWWASGLGLPEIGWQIGIALAASTLFITAFYFGCMGGGDVKMIGALALWLPLYPLIFMLIVMSLIGGVLTALMLIDKLVRRKSGDLEIPYGVAIACGALIALCEPYINHFGVNA